MTPLFKIAAFILFTAMVVAKPKTVGERFIYHLNTYNADSLKSITTDDFVLRRNFSYYTNSKTDFLTGYLTNSRKLHAKYRVIEKLSSGNPEVFLVEDQSDFFTYLLDRKVEWKLSIHTNAQNLVDVMSVDSTTGYKDYLLAARFVSDKFNRWLAETHPTENTNTLIADTTDLYTRRLIEFRKANK